MLTLSSTLRHLNKIGACLDSHLMDRQTDKRGLQHKSARGQTGSIGTIDYRHNEIKTFHFSPQLNALHFLQSLTIRKHLFFLLLLAKIRWKTPTLAQGAKKPWPKHQPSNFRFLITLNQRNLNTV